MSVVVRKPISDAARTVAENLAARRRLLAVRQEDLAAAAGISRSSVANIEAGRQEIMLPGLVAMAAALETSVGALLGEEGTTEDEHSDRLHALNLATALYANTVRIALRVEEAPEVPVADQVLETATRFARWLAQGDSGVADRHE